MYKKTCKYCNGHSYSTIKDSKWICPYCQKDISDVDVQWDREPIKTKSKEDQKKDL